MNENPYTPPAADIAVGIHKNADVIKLYSPAQVGGGTFLFGPLALICFLRENFSALDNGPAATKTVIYGALLMLGLLVLLPIIPESFPGLIFPLVSGLIAKSISEKFQKTKQEISESQQYDFHSNWRVLGLGLLCLLGVFVFMMAGLFLMEGLGILEL